MGLRETLEAATPAPWTATANKVNPKLSNVFAPNDAYGTAGLLAPALTPADARLIALAPELAALVLDMGVLLREVPMTSPGVHDGVRSSLLARLSRLGAGDSNPNEKEPSND